MPWVAFLALAALVFLVVYGLSRVTFLRRPGFEGIEDPAVAEAYGRISRWPQFRLLRRLFVGRLARYNPRGTLADVGCGPGLLVMAIARRFSDLHVMGLDTADEMVAAALANASSLGLAGRVEVRLGDASRLPLEDGSLDFVVSTLSLHHWTYPAAGLAELHRVLRPGGQMLLFDLRRDPRRAFYGLIRFAQGLVVPAALRRAKEPLGSLLASYTPAELDGLLRRSPFQGWQVDGGVGWVFVWARKG